MIVLEMGVGKGFDRCRNNKEGSRNRDEVLLIRK